MSIIKPIVLITLLVSLSLHGEVKNEDNFNLAKQTLSNVYQLYKAPADTFLLNETYPFNPSHVATYTVSDNQVTKQRVAYLWPTSGMLSGIAAMLEVSGDPYYKMVLDSKVIPGLNMYFDSKRSPNCYQSYINTEPVSDRFYDDNVWLVIDFADLYKITKDPYYLKQAELIWKFVISGWDDKVGGGIYWCEQKKTTKNTCSNAPSVVAATKLYQLTKKKEYLTWGKTIYEWTKQHLQDESDYLYFDNISLEGKVDKRKFAYNSGQMLQGAALLYKLTKEEHYLNDAKNIARNALPYFTREITKEGKLFNVYKHKTGWFYVVMARGYFELYDIDKDSRYIKQLQTNLNYIQQYAKYETGLFYADWTGVTTNKFKWLMDQACVIELAARLSAFK